MKKVAWITSDCYADTDFPVLKSFINNSELEIFWYFFYTKNKKIQDLDEEIYEIFENTRIKFKIIYLNSRLTSMDTLYKIILSIIKIKKSSPDVIYIDSEIDPYCSIFAKLFLPTSKIIYAIHDVIPHSGFSKKYRYIIKGRINLFRNFHLFSDNQKNVLYDNFSTFNKKIFCIPQLLKNFGKSDGVKIKDNRLHLLFFGRIRSNKGLDILIEAVNRLPKKYQERIKITIAGECLDPWNKYQEKIANVSIYNLVLKAIPNNEISDYFVNADFLILPYKDVTQSGPLMIAYNYNIPVICSNIDGFNEFVVNNVTGYTFESENSDNLANVIEYVINNRKDYLFIQKNLNQFIQKNYSDIEIIKQYIKMFYSIK